MQSSAVLLSGGLDSAVLAAAEIEDGRDVFPVHVRAGLAWEDAEAAAIGALLAVPPFAGRVRSIASLSIDMRDVYPRSHWAIAGRAPDYDEPDETVYLAEVFAPHRIETGVTTISTRLGSVSCRSCW